ncbi:uncharacterized protein EI97DRAFT_197214 [Westerdykella ornata]|uniref:Uncharacterized protein n=1 Tax=Westerdykella ornata TaxID=318751 RepID=A0A6A6J973_WESOR|nr:uncharacterized protein EI97DRAFT_197214 [Westerdykella ornata]KAF2272827.1 hypothetical protein EI97DRAFT_197214 [Westerdykella ornata]
MARRGCSTIVIARACRPIRASPSYRTAENGNGPLDTSCLPLHTHDTNPETMKPCACPDRDNTTITQYACSVFEPVLQGLCFATWSSLSPS